MGKRRAPMLTLWYQERRGKLVKWGSNTTDRVHTHTHLHQ